LPPRFKYDQYDSPQMKFMSLVMRDGAAAAIRQYREDMKENAVANALPEDGINRLGYGLLGAKKVDDAIRIFQWNVELYPKSWNVYDSLGVISVL